MSVTNSSGYNIGTVNPIRYRGYYYDAETGFYYLQSRYYDPVICRFINADAPELSEMTAYNVSNSNMFAYCGNNPVMRGDADGEFWHIIVSAAIGAVISSAVQIANNVISGARGGDIFNGVGTAALTGAMGGALTATGVGVLGSIVGNAAIAMTGNATNQIISNKGFNNFDVGDMLIDGAIGAVSGAISGAGASGSSAGAKRMIAAGKQSVKRTFRAGRYGGIRAYGREAGKAARYYLKSTRGITKGIINGKVRAGYGNGAVCSIAKTVYRNRS